jgi:hypothetical protein
VLYSAMADRHQARGAVRRCLLGRDDPARHGRDELHGRHLQGHALDGIAGGS